MSHVDEGRLQAWLDCGRSGMTEAEYIEVGAHLARCAECAALLAEERALRERASTILGGTGPRTAAAPAFDALAERARAAGYVPGGAPSRPIVTQVEEGRDRSGKRTRRPLVGLAWAASLVAALGLGWAASTLMDPEQVAIQTDASFERTSAGASAEEASRSRESALVGPAADQVAPEMVGPPSVGAPVEGRNWGGLGTMAAPRADATSSAGAPPPSSGTGSRSVGPNELVVAGFGGRSGPNVSGRAAAQQEEANPFRAPAAAAAPAADAGNDVANRSELSSARDGQGENVVISGRVYNADGNPIAGATVHLRGTNFATTSRQNGAFELTVPADAVAGDASLLASVLGFSPAEIPLSVQGGLAFQDIRLTPAAVNLADLVVVGYSQQTRQTLSGSVASTAVDAESTADRPSASMTRAGSGAPPAAPPAAPQVAGIATTEALGLSGQPAVIWPVVTAEQAGQRLGRAILIHPGFPLLRVEMPVDGQQRVVRVIHALPGGGNLTITQSPVAAGEPSPAPPGGVSLLRGDLIVTGTAPVSADSIATLLRGLR